jgi:hypothetical protein
VNATKSAKVNAATNTNIKTTTTSANGDLQVDAGVETDGSKIKGKSEEVKEVVVSEARSIKDKTKEERRDVKPGLNISNKTEANGSNETNVNGTGAEVNNGTEITSETTVKANGKAVKEKSKEVKEKAKEKTGEVNEKVKDVKKASVKSEAKVEGKVSAGKQ